MPSEKIESEVHGRFSFPDPSPVPVVLHQALGTVTLRSAATKSLGWSDRLLGPSGSITRPRFFVEFITSMHSVQALSGAEGLQNDILSMAEPLTGTIKSAWQ